MVEVEVKVPSNFYEKGEQNYIKSVSFVFMTCMVKIWQVFLLPNNFRGEIKIKLYKKNIKMYFGKIINQNIVF